ncbi:hypothetical protein EVAR_60214_1 [Eumeta japonica]|uniref:Uncharacterized protein n=1 Tax=Eumeta variegata TaxID=151549 RepID=A0A4C1Z985_EUMVA|nr:hypothetical protein EVAR_60214_1 [Eumeta japonica]
MSPQRRLAGLLKLIEPAPAPAPVAAKVTRQISIRPMSTRNVTRVACPELCMKNLNRISSQQKIGKIYTVRKRVD